MIFSEDLAVDMIICKGGGDVQGGALYDTAMIICNKGGVKMVRGVHYMTQQW